MIAGPTPETELRLLLRLLTHHDFLNDCVIAWYAGAGGMEPAILLPVSEPSKSQELS